MAILALALAQGPAWAMSDSGTFRSEKEGSSATSDQAEFVGPSDRYAELERSADEGENEDEDEVTTYRSTYDPNKAVMEPESNPGLFSRGDADEEATDDPAEGSRAGQEDEGL